MSDGVDAPTEPAPAVAPAPRADVQLGIDENGLGPRLGPMIVTAVRIEVDRAKLPDARALARAAARAGVGDSKDNSAHGAMAEAEALVLALLRVHLGVTPGSLTELMAHVGLEDEAAQRALCPEGEAPVACFGDPVPLPAFGPGPGKKDLRAAEKLRDAGVALRAARAAVACAKRMNVEKAAARSRFDLDLALMVRLAASLRPAGEAPRVVALCGKVGGRKSYAAALEPITPLVGVLGETRDRSSYQLPGFGELHFVLDGDASEPAIGMASQVGKYLRELWMHRHNRYWEGAVPGVGPVSGYHDPVTERLVRATALVRRERGIPDECFER